MPTTRGWAATASRIPGTARIGAIDTIGIGRADHDRVRRGEDVEHAGGGARRLRAVEADGDHRGLAALPHEPLFERELHRPVGHGRGDAGGDLVVGHRQQAAREAPGGGDVGGDRRERLARPQPLGAVQVGGEVAVADVEPGGHAVALERAEGHEGLAREAPAGLGVVGAGERVGDGIEVGADPQPVEPVVVAGIAHDDHIARIDHLQQPREEARRADSTCQGRDHAAQQ